MNETYEIIKISITAASAIISFLMWIINYKTLRIVKTQNDNMRRSLSSDTVSRINEAHRELFSQVLSNDSLTDILNDLNNTSRDETRRDIFCTMFFNHMNSIFSFYCKGLLGEDEWIGYQNDFLTFFKNISVASTRWNNVKMYYSEEYQEFVDILVNKGRLYLKK